ncbi:MAG: DUF4349 domain-containing protein [Acidobacteriota bacterium]
MKPKIAFLILAAVLFSGACRKASPAAAGVASDRFEPAPPPSEVKSVLAGPRRAVDVSVRADSIPAAPARTNPGKLIRNGEISVEVADFEVASRKAAGIAATFGGYVSDSQASGEGSRRRGTVSLRVRADSFERALAALKELGKVQSEHVSTNDITRAYTDLEARLQVKRDAAVRVREILKNRTARLADVLAAEKQLSELVEQIESMEGERRYYDQQVALSTIAAELHEPESVTRPSAFAPLRQALRDSVYNLSASLGTFVTGLLYLLPWAIATAAMLLVVRRVRRRRRER